MTCICQFCSLLMVGPEPTSETAESLAHSYRQLSFMVSGHMSGQHPAECQEIQFAMALAGASVSMRFVASADAGLDSARIAACELLQAAFEPRPEGPIASLRFGRERAPGGLYVPGNPEQRSPA